MDGDIEKNISKELIRCSWNIFGRFSLANGIQEFTKSS
jgi:hypothetical protein